jgi:hypothetical protein
MVTQGQILILNLFSYSSIYKAEEKISLNGSIALFSGMNIAFVILECCSR